MRTAEVLESDLTAKARIREAAMKLFAAEGVAASSLRAVARAAGVSPGLVVHHFGSKQGLIRAVDEAALLRINLALSEVPIEDSANEVIEGRAEVVAAFLRSQPVLCDYLGRALSERTEASAELFHRLFAFAAKDERLIEAGVLRADTDPFWRAMHLVVLVIGPLLLRPLIERELGGDLLAEENATRWTRARTDLLQHGLYAKTPTRARRGARTV
jgi:TetR/AcrR family transcriptional regulator, regulator of cefoperazone and chloramphenicol sensitivity